jgi:hypothetical protein
MFELSGRSVAVGLLSVGTAVGLTVLGLVWARRRRAE